MHDISKRILYYKRKDIQNKIVEACMDREVGLRYGDGFGKRPDVIMYENDILAGVKRGVTSFHVSEERWTDPLEIKTGMKKSEVEEIRTGWDLVLDIDCPYWFFSKLTAHLFIEALKMHGIKSISCKFSGNKGFHIGVPFEAFPSNVESIAAEHWFPEGPKRIATYLLLFITENLIEVKENEIIFGKRFKTTIEKISQITGKSKKDLSKEICIQCKNEYKEEASENINVVCPKCQTNVKVENSPVICSKCNNIIRVNISSKDKCKACGSDSGKRMIFDPLSIVEIDTILISSRHLYRAPYSLHEKSGLASIPINPYDVLSFEKHMANPTTLNISKYDFLDSENTEKGEATNLLVLAYDKGKEDLLYKDIYKKNEPEKKKNFEDVKEAIPVEYFPPCILSILSGVEDGRKRSMFVLLNFLSNAGWSNEMIEDIMEKWNNKNDDPIKDTIFLPQVRYHKMRKEKILPPNCKSYYQDFSVCKPDGLCQRIKNPVQYAKKRYFANTKKEKKSNYVRLTDEQKEMRKKYRQKLKREKLKSINKKDENIKEGT